MFSLHENTRLLVLRGLFLALCVFPVCAVVGWAAITHLPSYRKAHQNALGDELGWPVRLAAVHHPRPGATLYEQVEVFDPETGQILASLPFVEIEHGGKAMSIVLEHPATINAERLDALWQIASARLRDPGVWKRITISAQNLTLATRHAEATDSGHTLRELRGEARALDDQVQLKLAFRLASSPADAAESQLQIVRLHHANPPSSNFRLQTNGVPLPCCLLEPFWHGIAALGDRAQFRGEIKATHSAAGWSSVVQGDIEKVDLDQVLRENFEHRLSGDATIHLGELTVNDGRIDSAKGNLTAEAGVIGTSLLRSAEANLGFRLAPTIAEIDSPLIKYRSLGIDFTINPGGLRVRGKPPASAVLFDADDRPLVSQGSSEPQPALNLLRTLVPDRELLVPATQETALFARLLPVPSVQAPRKTSSGLDATTRRVTPKP